jgi:hypothetical protein
MDSSGTLRTYVSIWGTHTHTQTHTHTHTHTHSFRLDGTLHTGKIYVFAIVRHKEYGEDEERAQGETLFAQIRQFDDAGLVQRDVCGALTFKTSATKGGEKQWIHGKSLCTYMFKPKGTDKSLTERQEAVKIVPVAHAFVAD